MGHPLWFIYWINFKSKFNKLKLPTKPLSMIFSQAINLKWIKYMTRTGKAAVIFSSSLFSWD
jgi:hypothetical protein